LNIPSLVSRSLGAQELDIAFGQTEPLTRRLKNILADYTDGLSVLKELIQNADDAEASEIKFLYDERSNGDPQEYPPRSRNENVTRSNSVDVQRCRFHGRRLSEHNQVEWRYQAG
jgi:hypothetical protein